MPQPTAAAPDASLPGPRPLRSEPRWSDWRWQQARAATSLDAIEDLFPGRFDLASLDRPGIEASAAGYGLRVTPYYLDLARAASEQDPVWALAVPSPRELVRLPEERDDPIGDEEPRNHPLPGLTRRYPDRVLLFPTPTCAVHCRHCFRRRLVGNAEYALSAGQLDAALDWIAAQPELREVILTGGDPLTLADERLLALLGRLDALPRIRSLRIHTRLPVLNPFRVTPELAAGLGALSRPVTLVTHFNHPVEVTLEAREAVARLRAAGVDVLNQAVLLAGINADPAVHAELLWALHAARVRPYALHHADLVPGTGRFRTPVQAGRDLLRALRGTIPGPLLPQYLLDVPGGHGKVPLDHPWATVGEHGGLRLEAPDGSRHDYGPAGGPGAG